VKIISIENSEKNKVNMKGAEKAFKQIPISESDGSPNYSLRVFTLEPGGFTPYHNHNYEHLNYIIEGEGVLKDEIGIERKLKKGDFALVKPNEIHQYKNSSLNEKFIMICAVPKEFE
jgi:quercetin dioxygenase-like cupin family protein